MGRVKSAYSFLKRIFVIIAITISFNHLNFNSFARYTLFLHFHLANQHIRYFWRMPRFSLFMHGWITNEWINFVICLWLSLLSTDGFCNYIFFVRCLLQNWSTWPLPISNQHKELHKGFVFFLFPFSFLFSALVCTWQFSLKKISGVCLWNGVYTVTPLLNFIQSKFISLSSGLH